MNSEEIINLKCFQNVTERVCAEPGGLCSERDSLVKSTIRLPSLSDINGNRDEDRKVLKTLCLDVLGSPREEQ